MFYIDLSKNTQFFGELPPNPPAATITSSPSNGSQNISLSLQSLQAEEGENKRFLVVDNHFFRDYNFMRGACLQAFDEEFVACATSCDQEF